MHTPNHKPDAPNDRAEVVAGTIAHALAPMVAALLAAGRNGTTAKLSPTEGPPPVAASRTNGE